MPFNAVTRPGTAAAVLAMLAGREPHAILIAGQPHVGKTTLAFDIARGLLCTGAVGAERPCGTCRSCRMVDHGNHPDLHRLAPTGPGGQIVIGGAGARGIRDLVGELALLPVEGGARVAILEAAHRMNEDAQSALLKTLEEPPRATTLILCADDEDRLLPTVRSRCARLWIGPAATRDVESLLAARNLADAPTAARLARLTMGRTGLAVRYAEATGALPIHDELVRRLLDLLGASRAVRLSGARELVARAGDLASLLEPADTTAPSPARGRRRGSSSVEPKGERPDQQPGPPEDAAADGAETGVRVPAAERRRALAMLIEVWRDVARDLAVVGVDPGEVRDPSLLEELEAAAGDLPPGEAVDFLGRLIRASELLDTNVAPELLLDVLVLAWPRRLAAA
jgi:DNA polymerase III delta' subunit